MTCFYCALEGDGSGYDRNKACPDCTDWMRRGVICIGVFPGQDGQSPLRSGQWAVVQVEALDDIPGSIAGREQSRRLRVMFVDRNVWERLGLDAMSMAAEKRKGS